MSAEGRPVPRQPPGSGAPPPPQPAPGAPDTLPIAVQALLTEYNSLRQESLQAISAGTQIMNFVRRWVEIRSLTHYQ
ncbi:hypothetical protein [Streptomyces sp. NPDC059258]|uniref:hypothetical protein n=1 Tax=unclassified Streptomyces TaxID=2593676 RepID=UPI0036B8517B